MIPIVFSIPVHEKLEVVLDQIINFKFFNSECGIVLHFSDKFDYVNSSITKNEFKKIVRNIGNIFLNPESLRTGECDIIQAHLSNFNYIKELYEFEYFVLCASNELFIRHGAYQWIKEYDCVIYSSKVSEHPEWVQGKVAKRDIELQKLMREIDATEIIGTRVEGSCYKKDLFDEICKVINRNYDYRTMELRYAREEVFFSTIIWNWKEKGRKIRIYESGTLTYTSWEHCLKIKIDDIKHLLIETNPYFSVKRIKRDLNDYVRSYIREELDGGYYNYEFDLLKSVNSKVSLYDNKFLSPLFQFEKKDLSDLLHSMIDCLESIIKYGNKKQIVNIVLLLEDEYEEYISESIRKGDLEVLKLLMQINGMVCIYIKNNVIRPIEWLLLYVYEKALLERIREEEKIVLYGAGRYGNIFWEFLRKNDLSEKVSNFAISNLNENLYEINGVPVRSILDCLQDKERKKVFITVAQNSQKEMEECLKKIDFKNYEIISDEFINAIIKKP